MPNCLFCLIVASCLLLPASACTSTLVISSSTDTQVARGDNAYTPAVLLPYSYCGMTLNQSQCICESFPLETTSSSFVEFIPLEGWMEAAVLSATIVYKTYGSYLTAIVVNGKEVCVSTTGHNVVATCSFREWLVFGGVNEVVVRTHYAVIFEITIGFSQ